MFAAVAVAVSATGDSTPVPCGEESRLRHAVAWTEEPLRRQPAKQLVRHRSATGRRRSIIICSVTNETVAAEHRESIIDLGTNDIDVTVEQVEFKFVKVENHASHSCRVDTSEGLNGSIEAFTVGTSAPGALSITINHYQSLSINQSLGGMNTLCDTLGALSVLPTHP
jgi:hypothetical protein